MNNGNIQVNSLLEEEYRLTEEQKSNYRQDGHILLNNVADTRLIDEFRPVIGAEVKRQNSQSVPLSERGTYGRAFIQISNIWEHNEEVRRFVLARRFAQIAANLMGVDGVRIYHDQALFKEPGGGHTPWHQDQIYWPLDTMNTITMWMPLVDVSAEVGSMTFVSGSYHRGFISKLVISDESHKTLGEYIENSGLPQVNYGAMRAGDATFHAGWTLHCAPGTPTETMREVMTIIYVADRTRILEPDSKARENDLKKWMPGKQPGDWVDSPLNPLVFGK
ncbi:MAG: phytanoyl-CoA dioxygenase [Paenibacillaceae bacterium]|nr:phytanoyl-CoA dioxygenase [Paenibacillaceae bacterium]